MRTLIIIGLILLAFYYFAPDQFNEAKDESYSMIKEKAMSYLNEGLINCETDYECNERLEQCSNCTCISGLCKREI